MENKDINSNGFLPLDQLEKIAQEQSKELEKKIIEKKVENSKIVYDKKLYTKYEVTPQTFFYVKFGLRWLTEEDGEENNRLIITDYDKLNEFVECHWLKFRMWTYEESNNWKNQCTELDVFKNYIFNKNKLFKIKIKNLLLDWSFKENNPDMRLMHVNGILSDESLNLFMNLHPNILFFVEDRLREILELNK